MEIFCTFATKIKTIWQKKALTTPHTLIFSHRHSKWKGQYWEHL